MTREEATLVLDHARPQTAEIDRQFYDDEDLNTALDMGIEAIKQEPCEDAVSREKVWYIMTAGKYSDESCEQFIDRMVEELNDLPIVTPAHKKGKWIKVTDTEFGIGYRCSECGRFILTESVDGRKLKDYPYCHCGADMRGSEGKE